MELITTNLPTIWLLLIGFFLLYYALSDGADLGIGMLALISRDAEERETMMQSVHSIWHGNQTWLVILGGMLFGAFPLFYAIVLSALYVPFMIMLCGIIFRGVAFEFHANAEHKGVWVYSFAFGSLLTTLGQGFALGGLLGGIRVEEGAFTGSPGDWLNWFSLITTAGVICGYLMLGSGFLILKTTGELQERSYHDARLAGAVTIIVSAAVYLGTSALHENMAAKWVQWPPSLLYLFGFLALAAFFMYFRSLRQRHQFAPLVWNWLIIIFSFVGLSIGLYPAMIPTMSGSDLTVRDVAASRTTLQFMLAAMAILLPVILAYTTYSYWIFRGKVSSGEGYGDS